MGSFIVGVLMGMWGHRRSTSHPHPLEHGRGACEGGGGLPVKAVLDPTASVDANLNGCVVRAADLALQEVLHVHHSVGQEERVAIPHKQVDLVFQLWHERSSIPFQNVLQVKVLLPVGCGRFVDDAGAFVPDPFRVAVGTFGSEHSLPDIKLTA